MKTEVKIKDLPKVRLHPQTLKHLKLGHPWVTTDRFSEKFPKDAPFLCALDENQKNFCVLLNDPNHPKVKARYWGQALDFDFEIDLRNRFQKSLERRKTIMGQPRQNFYLVFGEADLLPGVMIQKLGPVILIQFNSFYWKKIERLILEILKKTYDCVNFDNNEKIEYLIQYRKEKKCEHNSNSATKKWTIQEWGINYLLKFGPASDFGIYTDMSAIRYKLKKYFEQSHKVLNLYSYTGAYSLFALSCGAKQVTSVDISQNNMDWLEENLKLNPQLNSTYHSALSISCEKALDKLKKDQSFFDLVVCDPPSVFSEDNKSIQALSYYPKLLSQIMDVTAPGGQILLFLNTHNVSMNGFEAKIKSVLKEGKHARITGRLELSDDCIILKGFPEGNYLKGLIISKK